METAVLSLQSLYDTLRTQVHHYQELGSCKEVLTKAETERGALEVKLKHARNQVDVEIRRRQKAEADCEKLDRQIQLIRDLLTSEGSSNSIQLSAEQRSALAFLNTNCQAAAASLNTSRRLKTIDESASILSDISYDKTDDSLDWDSSNIRTVRLKKREKRRSSRNHVDGPPLASKRSRSTGRTSERGNETLVTKTTVTVPANGGPVEAVSTIESIPYWTRSRRRTGEIFWDSESLKSEDVVFKQPGVPEGRAQPSTPQSNGGGVRLHEFVSKTVIKPESCVPCGKRIKFGKISLKCRDCKVVSHPECRERCPLPCIPNLGATPVKIGEGVLADYVPDTSPMIPPLVVHCISEIEQRGLREAGLYRLSGSDRTVKELKEKFLRSKTVPVLSKVDDIHAITGLFKDFLRNLKEPLLTFRLNRPFMEAADDDNSIALIYQTISDLPQANRDTLAFVALHLQRVASSLDTKMDIGNLARVFGPTIVGHAVPNPEPMTILQDTKRQPKVVQRLLSLPADYWGQFVMAESEPPNLDHLIIENANCYATPDRGMSMLGPLTTPEHQLNKTPSSSSLSQRMKSSLTPRFGSKSKSAVGFSRQGKFFASPLLK
uniref:Rac GTPase-activating protein 1 n=1 Tax=Scophthalmus maximus TaxID=52904 RepID=A0A8D3BGX6_SCOMX